ncbi:MAG: hypothetical protein HEQ13_15475 [Dolichospermum sp. DEX189]|jgi:hypothetical protein|uniref:hypothetical protein n=1 Tax=Dolichospermum circinale TaxID=109265 RepID=UPI001BD0AC68|nr:hypothetical protein [Dolichospermum circinale]MBO1070675.1 hypothetical protein [Dolichospermum sp. DEX189]MBS9388383.1 hypothetical protein [Dolichospermum sp. WA123]MDB9448607.1 hypothetical protein [Dolichospermum circinale CS-547]
MQTSTIEPLKIIIPGEYYDSQIYDGKLYLWGANSSISVLNWNGLVENINIEDNLKLVLKFAIQYGDDLYNNLLFQEPDIKDIILTKFKKLVKNPIEISHNLLVNHTVSEKDNPLPFPHADSSIHYKTVYVGSQSGISHFNSNSQLDEFSKIKTKKISDLPVLSLSASHLTLALAAGSEGLFDYYIGEKSNDKQHEPRCINEHNSNFVRWLYPSVFSSSYFDESYFADFKITKKRKNKPRESMISENQPRLLYNTEITREIENLDASIITSEKVEKQPETDTRYFQKLFSVNEIFETFDNNNEKNNQIPEITWGTHDKIYLVKKDHIQLAKCNPTKRNEKQKFIDIGSVELEKTLTEIISADSSFFGIVLEQDDGLLIITSMGQYISLPGEPINWRVFPNSKNYTNQLHVIYEDSIHIYSFNHDFFVNQADKKIGISFGKK